jgi:hypothetical protein
MACVKKLGGFKEKDFSLSRFAAQVISEYVALLEVSLS